MIARTQNKWKNLEIQKKKGADAQKLTSRQKKENDFMKNFKMFAAVFSLAALMTSCTLTMPVTATSNPVGNKVGESTGTVFLQIFAFDADASIRTAAKNGGITKVSTVDIKQTNILGIVTTYTTIVTGE